MRPFGLIPLSIVLLGYRFANANGDSADALQAVLTEPLTPQVFETYLSTLPKVGERYVVEGDLLMSADEVREHVETIRSGPPRRDPGVNTELLLATHSGEPGTWSRTQRQLTYAVDRASFPVDEFYEEIVERMAEATKQWMDKCPTCDLSFTHRVEKDSAPSHDDVTFIVRYFDAGGEFAAAAFFPFTAPEERYIEIDLSFFEDDLAYNKTGVLRHELGHVMGYRHEHIRSGLPGCFVGNEQWIALTPYDSNSVMHYLCGGVGNSELEISDGDALGQKLTYGTN